LGVTGAYLGMVRSGKARAGDGLSCQALKYVTEGLSRERLILG